MGLMDKIMHNISGLTVGALFFAVGDLAFKDPSIMWLKNIFVFGGLFIILAFLAKSFREYVEWLDPNYGRVTEVAALTEKSLQAMNRAKAKAFDMTAVFFALLILAFSVMEAPWYCMAALLAAFILIQGIFLVEAKKQFRALWKDID